MSRPRTVYSLDPEEHDASRHDREFDFQVYEVTLTFKSLTVTVKFMRSLASGVTAMMTMLIAMC